MFSRNPPDLRSILHRERPSKWRQFWRRPIIFLAQYLYSHRPIAPRSPAATPVSVVCISDTHNGQVELPEGDVLIHAGDLTQSGTFNELEATIRWLGRQPHPHKIVVAGNHDVLLDPSQDRFSAGAAGERGQLAWGDITYLQDQTTTITCANGRVLNIYGSPKSVRHGNGAFQYPRAQDVWKGVVPGDTDILVTHGPPRAHLDLNQLGCERLLQELWRVRPLLHVFGHIHEGHGQAMLEFDPEQAAYEQALRQKGRLLGLLSLCWHRVIKWFSSKPGTRNVSVLVNAAIVGGLRDERRREPIVVRI